MRCAGPGTVNLDDLESGVWSTPRNPGAFARRLDRFTRRHSHDSGMGNVVKFHRREDEA